LSQVVEACGRMSRDDAGVYLRRMEANGRYVVEAW
jgi:sulfite reductase alpha subunit-like flavoprotein